MLSRMTCVPLGSDCVDTLPEQKSCSAVTKVPQILYIFPHGMCTVTIRWAEPAILAGRAQGGSSMMRSEAEIVWHRCSRTWSL